MTFEIRTYPYLLLAVVATAGGCRTPHYRAATLPAHLRAPSTVAQDINLANFAELSSNSTRIGRGDLVEITIVSGGEERAIEPILARVDENGAIELPLIGQVMVEGYEPIEAGDRIAAASIDRGIYRKPTVVLKVEQPAVNHVTVLGAVTKPGVQEVPRGSSDVLSAIAAAGGFTEEASTELQIKRPKRKTNSQPSRGVGDVVPASFNQPFAAPPPLDESELGSDSSGTSYHIDLADAVPGSPEDFVVGDGDVVMVLPKKQRLIHVSGLVNKPDQFELPSDQDVHVLDAIAMAGGIKSPVADKVYIIRRIEGQLEPAIIEVRISDAKADGTENLRLAAGDMVSVEATMLTHTVDTLTTFFRMSFGIGGNFTSF